MKLEVLGELKPAEKTIWESVASGEWITLGDGSLPEAGTAEREVRGAFLCDLFLAKDGFPRVHERGLRVEGAWVSGVLSLDGCDSGRTLALVYCRFETAPDLSYANLRSLILNGSHCPGLKAFGLKTSNDIQLGVNFTSTGKVTLIGADIGGGLVGEGGKLLNRNGDSLIADRAKIQGSLLLRNGFHSEGVASFVGANIGGNLECDGAYFHNVNGDALIADGAKIGGSAMLRYGFGAEGTVRFVNAEIGGDLDCTQGNFSNLKGDALLFDRATVKGCFFLKEKAKISGGLDLSNASFALIEDPPDCWPDKGNLILNGCTYTTISGGPVDAKSRLDWLALQDPQKSGEDFWPQPYEQLAKVLRSMGHRDDARRVLLEKERLQDRDERRRFRVAGWFGKLRAGWHWVWSSLLDLVTGHGYYPRRALYLLVALVVVATLLASAAWQTGAMVPTGAVETPEWAAMDLACPGNLAACWSDRGAPGQDHDAFNALAYGIDAVVPLLAIGQQDAWMPSAQRGVWGQTLWWARWPLEALGWIITTLGLAAVTGLIRND